MKAKIILNQPLTQERYGLHFEKGEAYTDNEYIINKLQAKGVKVEVIKEEKTIDEMTVAELKDYATAKNIEIPSNITKKGEIVDFIKNYKEDEKTENPEENEGESGESPDNPETKPDNSEQPENPEEKTENE